MLQIHVSAWGANAVSKGETKFKGSFPIPSVLFLCKQEPPRGSLQRISDPHNKSDYFNQDSDCQTRKALSTENILRMFPKQDTASHLNQPQFSYTEEIPAWDSFSCPARSRVTSYVDNNMSGGL